MTARAARLARLAALLGLKSLAGAWAVHDGFSHVSDDDYARVVIAERFAHAPSLDPSGTSWLPWPFWANGAAMAAIGRSLATASFVAWGFGLASVLIGYWALRTAGVARTAAFLATALAATSPWSVWLGVATVPEALTAPLVFAGAMTLAAPRSRVVGGALLLVASLSRYEAWPVCGVFALVCAVDALRTPARGLRSLLPVLLSLAGPCAWMAWNAYAHGSALHFVARVATFHDAHDASPGAAERWLLYPRALVEGAPEIVLVGAFGLFGGADVRARWRLPLLAAGATLAFLVYGQSVGGAPTHHPERALLAVWWILAGFGVDGARALVRRTVWARPKREAWVVALGVATAGALLGQWLDRLSRPPGRSPGEDRSSQVALGLRLRAEATDAVTLRPCAFEHFAVIAAFGAPERVTIAEPRAGSLDCPTVSLR